LKAGHIGILIAAALATACHSTAKKQVPQARTGAPVVSQPAPRPVILPAIPRPEPTPSAIASSLSNETTIDPVGVAIVESRMRFETGQDLYRNGFMAKARNEFDTAVDNLLESSSKYPQNPRIQREILELVTRIHTLELAAVQNGDGFADQAGDHAAIDDLQNVTFPPVIDPKLKQVAEAEVRADKHDLPIELNDRVLGFLEYYQNGRGRNSIIVGLERMGMYRPMIQGILREEGVPLDLIYLCQAESAFLPRALSRA